MCVRMDKCGHFWNVTIKINWFDLSAAKLTAKNCLRWDFFANNIKGLCSPYPTHWQREHSRFSAGGQGQDLLPKRVKLLAKAHLIFISKESSQLKRDNTPSMAYKIKLETKLYWVVRCIIVTLILILRYLFEKNRQIPNQTSIRILNVYICKLSCNYIILYSSDFTRLYLFICYSSNELGYMIEKTS